MITVLPVILCGGSGTRLWPLSRAAFPKQFLVLSGTRSLFQNAVARAHAVADAAAGIAVGETLVVTNEEHRFLAREQLASMGVDDASLLLEPVGRSTAPALTLAALHTTASGEDPVLLVCPADHAVADLVAFTAALQAAVHCAASGAIVTLAVTPSGPETGYGYVQRHGEAGPHGECAVQRFVEKPDLQTARAYVQSGQYAWNSGIFVLRASVWLNALRHFRPDIFDAATAAWQGRSIDAPFVRPDSAAFAAIASESIDYAVMEHCPGSAFSIQSISLNAGWSDLGAWDAAWQVGDKDAGGNVTHGDALLADATGTLVHASHRLVAAVGVKDLVIVETADAVLVTERSRSQDAGARDRAQPQPRRRQAGGRAARTGSQRTPAAPQNAPALGLVRQHRRRSGLQGQTHPSQARRSAQPAKAPPSCRALDRGHGRR